jgi:hypothetical protein
MVANILLVVDAKATGTMLYQSSVLSPDSNPFCFLSRQSTEKLCSFFRYISLSTCNILDFFTKILVICSSSNWIPAQGINVHVPESWSMYYFETKVL